MITGTAGREDRPIDPTVTLAARSELLARHLKVLGLGRQASLEEIDQAYRRLVSDLTPGRGANHSRVALALAMLDEVNEAYASVRSLRVA